MSASRAVLHFVCKCSIATAPFFAAWSAPRVAIGRYRLRRGVQLARQIDVHHVTAVDSPGSGKAGQCPLPELASVEDNPPAGDCVTGAAMMTDLEQRPARYAHLAGATSRASHPSTRSQSGGTDQIPRASGSGRSNRRGRHLRHRAHPHRSRDGLPAAVESGAVSAWPWGPGLAVDVE